MSTEREKAAEKIPFAVVKRGSLKNVAIDLQVALGEAREIMREAQHAVPITTGLYGQIVAWLSRHKEE